MQCSNASPIFGYDDGIERFVVTEVTLGDAILVTKGTIPMATVGAIGPIPGLDWKQELTEWCEWCGGFVVTVV